MCTPFTLPVVMDTVTTPSPPPQKKIALYAGIWSEPLKHLLRAIEVANNYFVHTFVVTIDFTLTAEKETNMDFVTIKRCYLIFDWVGPIPPPPTKKQTSFLLLSTLNWINLKIQRAVTCVNGSQCPFTSKHEAMRGISTIVQINGISTSFNLFYSTHYLYSEDKSHWWSLSRLNWRSKHQEKITTGGQRSLMNGRPIKSFSLPLFDIYFWLSHKAIACLGHV